MSVVDLDDGERSSATVMEIRRPLARLIEGSSISRWKSQPQRR